MNDKEVMMNEHLKGRDISNSRVLKAMESVPRELFVPKGYESTAYADIPLPIGKGQTISQPYVVALMAQALNLKGDEKILEIGTGSGYNAAVLSKLCRQVISLERIEDLALLAKERLEEDYSNVKVIITDGSRGYEKEASYDRIVLTAYCHELPSILFEQLKDRGYLIAPIGDQHHQTLKLYKKLGDRLVDEDLLEVMFVPLVSGEEIY